MSTHFRADNTSSMLISVFFCAPAFVAMITFGTCIIFGTPLETGKVLSALATFRQLQGPIYSLPDAVPSIIQTKVSLDRICSFLCLEELASDVVTKLRSGSTDISIKVRNGIFSWEKSSQVPTLKDLDFCVQQGTRVAYHEASEDVIIRQSVAYQLLAKGIDEGQRSIIDFFKKISLCRLIFMVSDVFTTNWNP